MEDYEKVEAIVKRMAFAAGTEIDRRLWAGIEDAMEGSRTQAVLADWHPRRFFMPSLIPQLAFGGAPFDAIVFELSGTGRDSNPEVPRANGGPKAQPSQGMTLRIRETMSTLSDNADYAIKYFSPTRSRTDAYKDGQMAHSFYANLETMTHIGIFHTHKHYISSQITREEKGFLKRNEDWLNPRYLREAIQSVEHRELGSKTIDGIECEGIETTDVAVLGPLPSEVTRLDVEMRLWVDARTEYPVQFEGKMDGEAEGKRISLEYVMEQFQWDVELDPNLFEPDLTGYEDMRNH